MSLSPLLLSVISSSILCLALAIYSEARGEDKETKLNVASVVIERSHSWFEDDICATIYSKNAFSGMTKRYKVKDKVTFSKSKKLAHKILKKKVKLPLKGRLFFNREELGKRHKTKYKPIISGNMVFY